MTDFCLEFGTAEDYYVVIHKLSCDCIDHASLLGLCGREPLMAALSGWSPLSAAYGVCSRAADKATKRREVALDRNAGWQVDRCVRTERHRVQSRRRRLRPPETDQACECGGQRLWRAREVLGGEQLGADGAPHRDGKAIVVLGNGTLEHPDAATEQHGRLIRVKQHPHRNRVRAAARDCAECNRQQGPQDFVVHSAT